MAKRRRLSVRRFKRRGRRGGGYRRLRRTIKRVIRSNTEIKYSNSTNGTTLDANTFWTTYISPQFPVGSDKNARIGNKIKYKMLTVNFEVFLTATGLLNNSQVRTIRVLIWQPRYVVGSTGSFVLGDIMDSPTNWLSTVKGTSCRLMYDKMFVVSPSGPLPTSPLTLFDTNTGAVVKKLHFRNRNNVTFRSNVVSGPDDPKDLYLLTILTSQLGAAAGVYSFQARYFSKQSYIDM